MGALPREAESRVETVTGRPYRDDRNGEKGVARTNTNLVRVKQGGVQQKGVGGREVEKISKDRADMGKKRRDAPRCGNTQREKYLLRVVMSTALNVDYSR